MNRLYILLTVMVVMVGALFAGQEALAEVLTGTAGEDTLVGTDRGRPPRRSRRRRHDQRRRRRTTKSSPAKATTTYSPEPATTCIFARDTDGRDYIDCGIRLRRRSRPYTATTGP